jgi:MraZ protein
MFRGQFAHSIDAKGRVSLPVRFRDGLVARGDSRFILTPALFDPCLHLYPMQGWEELEEKIAGLPSFDPNIVRFRRLYVSAAIECELDKAGRVLVPPALRERVALVKDVLWAGMGRTVELWAKERWDAAIALSADERVELERAVMEQIRV